jgi:hypothetical protein
MVQDRLSVALERLFGMNGTDRPVVADPRLRVVAAVLYVAGLALMIMGSVGAFLWTPALWCAVAGLVAIAAALAVTGGRLYKGFGIRLRPHEARSSCTGGGSSWGSATGDDLSGPGARRTPITDCRRR